MLPKEFGECPNCGSTRRFCEEALKDDLPEDDLKPILQSGEYVTQPPGKLFPIKLMALMDVCVQCGTVYAVALFKTELKPPKLTGNGGGHKGPLIPGRW